MGLIKTLCIDDIQNNGTQHNRIDTMECRYAKCPYAECHYAESLRAECRFAECFGTSDRYFYKKFMG